MNETPGATASATSPRRFTQALVHLSEEEIHALVESRRSRRAQADDALDWWQATIALERALRRCRRGPLAAAAAAGAVEAVLAAAARRHLGATADEVLSVAAAAGEVARVLVAGVALDPVVAPLVRGWEAVLTCCTSVPCQEAA